eukprot:2231120-Pyramimonas_sp.AAC.1
MSLIASTRSELGAGSGDVADGDRRPSSSPRGTCALSLPIASARPPASSFFFLDVRAAGEAGCINGVSRARTRLMTDGAASKMGARQFPQYYPAFHSPLVQ